MIVRRGDRHGLDGNEAEWSSGDGWEHVDPARIREEYIRWALECHRLLDTDCKPVKARPTPSLIHPPDFAQMTDP